MTTRRARHRQTSRRRRRTQAIAAALTEILMNKGCDHDMKPSSPVMRIIGFGPRTTLEISDSGAVFATLTGRGLRQLAARFRPQPRRG